MSAAGTVGTDKWSARESGLLDVGAGNYTPLTGRAHTSEKASPTTSSVDGKMINYGETWMLLPSSHILSMNVILPSREELRGG